MLALMRALAAAVLAGLLAGCSYFQNPQQSEGTIVAPGNFRAGSGVIQSVGVLRNANPTPVAMPNSMLGTPDPNLYRLAILMDGDGFQTVDIDNGTFVAGEAVQLTNDGRVVRVSGTSLNKALEK